MAMPMRTSMAMAILIAINDYSNDCCQQPAARAASGGRSAMIMVMVMAIASS